MLRRSSAKRFGGSGMPSGVCSVARRSAALRRVGLKLRMPSRARVDCMRLTRRVRSATRHSRSRLGRLASSSAIVGMRTMLQWPRSPRSHPRNPRFSNSVSSRSVFARRCSRETATLEDYIAAVEAAEARRDRLTAQTQAMLPDWTLAPVVAALQTMRGMALINAATLIAELGDLSRFANPRQLMAYLGLVPSEHSSGASVKRGGITKAGNAATRRLLIEAAWSYRFPARLSRELLLRQERQPRLIRDIAWKGQLRLCGRYRRLARTGKPANIVTTAIARELSGFVWAIARQVTVTTD